MVKIILLDKKLIKELPKYYEIFDQDAEIKRYVMGKYTKQLKHAKNFFENALKELMKKEYYHQIKRYNDKTYWTKNIIERSNIFFNVAVYNIQTKEEIESYKKNGFYLVNNNNNNKKNLNKILKDLEKIEIEIERNKKNYNQNNYSNIIPFK